MGCGASSTNGPLAGPSGSGLAGIRGLRQQKEQIQPVFQDMPGLDVADAKIVGKIAARDLADDETTIGCGESITGDFGDNASMIGADEIPAPVAPKPSGSFRRKTESSKDVPAPSAVLMQKLALSFLESAKSGELAAALSRSSGSSCRKSDVPAPQTVLKEKLSLSFVQSAKAGALAAAFEQVNKEREEKRMKEADAKLKLCKALVGSAKDGGLAAAFSKALAERK
eukprot:gnl/MRDRNA2_/MRDRNA2_125303_c0_seq1.p1 gnl/MRDRNA2_/MRDRNA2_125303_c0~~gnl/MRDRNA2_/MRDRNA2_125303_c0_seq1.p1  ORF type:complete len:226 (-),score=61.06 gnl/MRDRNA2_/MRDRNA2_125303_c0_seq1:108-785(-)